MTDHPILEAIRAQRVIGIVRSPTAEQGYQRAQGLLGAGLKAVEVSLSTPDALRLVRALPGVGVGTVHTLTQAQQALDAGAAFLVAPVLVPEVMYAARAAGVPVVPGAGTATEVLRALDLGAELVKLFPASLFSPSAVADLLQGLPQAKLVPTGGVSLPDAPGYFAAGAAAVGLGSALTPDNAADVLTRLRPAACATTTGQPLRPSLLPPQP